VNIVARTVNSTAIKVTWQAPLNPNGEINYRLYHWQSNEGVGTELLAYDGPLLEHTVAGLHEFVTYTFMLQAYNVKHLWTGTAINATETTHPAGETFSVYIKDMLSDPSRTGKGHSYAGSAPSLLKLNANAPIDKPLDFAIAAWQFKLH